MNVKTARIGKDNEGEYNSDPFKLAAQNDMITLNCGSHYTLLLSTGIKKGFWITTIGLYTLPYMEELQVRSITGRLNHQMKMECQ